MQWLMDNAKQVLYATVVLLVLLVGAYWYVDSTAFERGKEEMRAEYLAQKPDTTTHQIKVPDPEPIIKYLPGKPIPVAVDYQAKIDSAVTAAKDSMEAYLRSRLNPFQTFSTDSTQIVLDDGTSFYLKFYQYLTAHPLTLSIESVLQPFGIEIPLREITKYVPIETGTPFQDIVLYGAIPGMAIMALILYAIGAL